MSINLAFFYMLKDVDELAPPVWIRLMKSSSQEEMYHELNSEETALVEKWRSKRGAMLQTRIQQEVQAKLEDEPSLERDSTPFIRLVVQSHDRSFLGCGRRQKQRAKLSNTAVLTVWSPTEEQLHVLREGAVVRAQSMSAGKRMYDGKIQVTGNSRTPMAALPSTPQSQEILKLSGYTERNYSSVFQLHVSSRRLLQSSTSRTHASDSNECDFFGVILKVTEEETCKRASIYLVDKSNLVVRVQCEHVRGLGSLIGLCSPFASQCVEQPRIAVFRDVTVAPFDKVENCAVVEFRGLSSFRAQSAEPLTGGLKLWAESVAGRQHLSKLAAYWDAGLSIVQRSQATYTPAIGYIAGFTIQDSQLRILVDCAAGNLHEWALPPHLVNDLKLPESSYESVSLSPKDEETYSRLSLLGKIFIAKGVLFRFTLKRTPQTITSSRPCEFEVSHITQADPELIASVYEAAQRGEKRKGND